MSRPTTLQRLRSTNRRYRYVDGSYCWPQPARIPGFVFRSGGSKKPAGVFVYDSAAVPPMRPFQLAVLGASAGGYISVELNFATWAKAWAASIEKQAALRTLKERWGAIPALVSAVTPILGGLGDPRSVPMGTV